jgi:hypothetical protein
MVRRVAGIRNSSNENLKKGDIAIVEGNATVVGIAEIGEYRYESDGLPEAKSHTYWRDVEYLHTGPVRIRDLPQRFHQGGENSLHLPSTVKPFGSADEDVLEALLNALDEAQEVQQTDGFIDFSEASIQSYLEDNIEELISGVTDLKREYSNQGGYADFVCELPSDEVVVIETKIGTADHAAVSQLMSYMNSIRSNRDQDVRGLLVAEDFSGKAKLSARSDDIGLYRFKAKLEFEEMEN